jgi:hypothetical protein
LQVLPIISFYVLKNTKLTIGLSLFYGLLALGTLIQALQGRPLIKSGITQNKLTNEIQNKD